MQLVNITVLKDLLNDSFKELRRLGITARQNYWCCQSCAGYELGTQTAEKVRAGKAAKLLGHVFYTKQDTENMYEHRRLFLSFGQSGCSEFGDFGPDTIAVGQTIVGVLRRHGLHVKWDGTAQQRILVTLAPSAPLVIPMPDATAAFV